MVRDGVKIDGVSAMASLGSDGRWPSNVARDLHVWLKNLYQVGVEPYMISVPLQSPGDLVPEECLLPCLLPHEVIHALWQSGWQQFQISLLGPGGPSSLVEYWRWSRQQEWGVRHPALVGKSESQLSRMLPLMLHVDGAEVFRNNEFYIICFRSPLAEGAPFDIIFPFMMVRHSHMNDPTVKKQVFARACAVLSWSFGVAEQGVGPSKGFHGEEFETASLRHRLRGAQLAGGFTACYVGIKHDSKAKAEIHVERQWYSCTYICHQCHAVQGFKNAPKPLFFADFGKDTIGRATAIDNDTYLRIAPVAERSSLFQIRGHRTELAYWDWLHVCPLGILRDHCATHIYIWLVEHLIDHAILDFQLALRALWASLRGFCKVHRLRTFPGGFTMASIGSPSSVQYPELSSTFKASAVKTITTFVADVSYRVEKSDTLGKVRCANTWAIAELQHVLDAAGPRLHDEELHRCLQAAHMYLMTWQFLANTAMSENKTLFKCRPKHHFFCHIIERIQLDRQNPCRQLQCAGEETFMGVLKRIGLQTHGSTAYLRTLQRYLLYVAVRWEQRRRSGCWFLK